MSIPDSGGDLLAGFIDDYFAECDEHLTLVRQILVTADADAGLSPPALEELFRSFHSLKGLSGMVELRDAELVAHHMESYLRVLREGRAELGGPGLDILFQSTQVLEQVIAARRNGQPPPSIVETTARLARIAGAGTQVDRSATGPNSPAAQGAAGPWRAVFIPSTELAARGVTVDYVRSMLRKAARIVNASPIIGTGGTISFEFTLDGVIEDWRVSAWAADGITITAAAAGATVDADRVAGGTTEPGAGTAGSMLTSSQFVRVDLARLDELMRGIGDLVISRARLGESLSQIERHVPAAAWRTVQENTLALERQLRDLRDGVMRVRLVPVGEIFRRMSFVVRDLARETGKLLDLAIAGLDTEIDKFLVERMMDPVLHLVRNAVSHGIETAAERVAAGKPASGRLTLAASSVGNRVTIEVSDDGQGVDATAVARRARDIGMVIPEGPLEGAALLDVLCAPGFSTRDAADLAAGRGVGMNVVLSTVRELGGTVALDTAPGEGARFVIELPLTLAITDAIVAAVGGQLFAVPQSGVREVIEVDPGALQAIENHEIAAYRGGILPIVRLATICRRQSRPGRALHVFVVGQGASTVGVAVDRIHGQREIVVRPMTDALVRVEGVTGATDLGDGRVVLILDLVRLILASTRRRTGVSVSRASRSRT